MFGAGINQIIGLIWQHPRPFVIGLGQTWMSHVPDSSFPSDHVTVFASVVVSLLMARKFELATIALAVCLSVAWSRIFLGVHFPMDMVGALLVAAFSYAIAAPIWQKTGSAITRFVQQRYRTVMAIPIAQGWTRP
jgi:undecaprenyl-diphosphatase